MVLDGHEVREMTDTELAQHELDKAEAAAQAAAQAAKALQRQAVLDKLGLTADEAAALLG
jgi:adenylylsulfate kinase-like enzyme